MEQQWRIENLVVDDGRAIIVSGTQRRVVDRKDHRRTLIETDRDRVLRLGETVFARFRIVGFDESGLWTGPVLATPLGRTRSLLDLHQYGLDPDCLATGKELRAALSRR